MNEFDRTELKMILEGLDALRERMRAENQLEMLIDSDGKLVHPLPRGDEYNKLVRLQDRIIDEIGRAHV